MDLNDIKWENGHGLSGLAIFGTNPIGTMLDIAIELLEDLGPERIRRAIVESIRADRVQLQEMSASTH